MLRVSPAIGIAGVTYHLPDSALGVDELPWVASGAPPGRWPKALTKP